MHTARLLLVPLLVATSFGCLEPLGPNDVDLSLHTQYVQRTKVDRVADKTGESVVALFPGDGGWETRELVHRGQDGRFAIPEVPEGRYYLRREGARADSVVDYHDTDARTAKLEPRYLGEPAEGIPTTAQLTLSSENAPPSQGGGTLCMSSIAAGLGGVCGGFVQDPSAGNLRVTYNFASLPLAYPNMDLVRKGDDFIVHQLDWTLVNDGTMYGYATTGRGVGVADLDMEADPFLDARMIEAEQDRVLDVSYDRGSFEALFSAGHPQAQPWSHDVSVELALKTANTTMFVGDLSSWVVFAELEPGTSVVPVDLAYGNPLSAPWTEVVRGYSYASKAYRVPTSSGTLAEPLYRVVSNEVQHLSTSAPATLKPLLSPPAQVTIDGRPFVEDGMISASPLISWSAPATGTAESYLLRVYEMYADTQGRTRNRLVARFHTRERSLQLPPLFASGTRVTFTLLAKTGTLDASDAVVTHTATGLPNAAAMAASGLFRVQ